MVPKQYVGPIPHLRGRTAEVWPRDGVPGQVMAQFDDGYLMESRGGWEFGLTDFQPDTQEQ